MTYKTLKGVLNLYLLEFNSKRLTTDWFLKIVNQLYINLTLKIPSGTIGSACTGLLLQTVPHLRPEAVNPSRDQRLWSEIRKLSWRAASPRTVAPRARLRAFCLKHVESLLAVLRLRKHVAKRDVRQQITVVVYVEPVDGVGMERAPN